ncbi:hypothetical protein HZA33_05405 [Candidatus Pacearchaeota archaeon]|nr:hypothetical protein [Candidatus Pacearchaeota archaeon]
MVREEGHNNGEIDYFRTDALLMLYKYGPLSINELIYRLDQHTATPTQMVVMHARMMFPDMDKEGKIKYDSDGERLEITKQGIIELVEISKRKKELPEIISREMEGVFTIH